MDEWQGVGASVQPCARLHALPATFLEPDPLPAPAAPGMALCMACLERLRWRLRELPDLIGHVREIAVPALGSSAGKEARVDGTRDWREPFNRAAMDDADNLWATLALFAQRVAGLLEVRVPHDVGAGQVAGITTAADHHVARAGAKRVTDWMDSWLEDVAADADLAVWMHDDLVPLIGKLRKRYGFTSEVRRAHPRPCESCGQQEVRIAWEGDLPSIRCQACGFGRQIEWEVVADAAVADVSAGG